MTSDSKHDKKEDYLASILSRTAKAAIEGKMTDTDRVAMYRIALTVAAEEFYRIESNGVGGVSPEVLLLLQQIALICEDGKVDRSKLLGGMGITEEDVSDDPQDEDSGGSVEDAE